MTLLCLIGRHGSGKSTLGDKLSAIGFKHINVGLLRRLARNGHYPSDVPVTLIAALRRFPVGAPMSEDIAKKLLAYAGTFENCVIDGLPASPDQLEMLPKETVIGVVWVPRHIREIRLTKRSESTVRQWTPGRQSAREKALASVIAAARNSRRTVFIRNRENSIESVASIAESVAAILGIKLA